MGPTRRSFVPLFSDEVANLHRGSRARELGHHVLAEEREPSSPVMLRLRGIGDGHGLRVGLHLPFVHLLVAQLSGSLPVRLLLTLKQQF